MKIKRILIVLLAFMFVFSTSASATGSSSLLSKEEISNKKPSSTEERISKEELDKLYKSTDEVRVIVEVKGDPAVTYATKKGVKFTDLPKPKQVELQDQTYDKQNDVKQGLTNSKIDMKYEQDFVTAFNGFSGTVEYGEIKLIEGLPGVATVTISTEYERPDATPDMKYSKELVEAQRTWDEYGYDGEGMIVGVIDTGADPSHKDFILTDDEEGKLSEDDVSALIADKDLPGEYHTAKVPYGYNYMDESQEILDLGPEASMHGMHVAGTVGSNGDEDEGGIKGVAPEAQILALKVFGNDPNMGSTWGDIYIKAIDDSINLGADVLNMSLGSVASFVDSDNPEQQAIKNAVENGILMSISAGNSAHLGNGFYNPYASNPDIGVVGAPGLSYEALQVASIENSHIEMDAITYVLDDEEVKAPFVSQGDLDPADVDQKEFELKNAGLGGPSDFEGKDFTDKYALMERGEHAFTDKVLNAQAAGAKGAIIYNNEDGMLNMETDPAIEIPQLFMFKSDGAKLAEELEDGNEIMIEFQGDGVTASNPGADQMSEFTSWGVTPNLDFKPEITAPGGSILSTFQDDEYGMMSGTSMSAPHVAGGSALMLQRVDEVFDLEGKDRVTMAENILMNTSLPVLDKGAFNASYGPEEGVPYSPRRQGTGLMKLHAATSTPVVVTELNTKEAKVALKEVGDEFTFTLTATNFSDKRVSYDLGANIQTDLQVYGLLGNAQLTGELDKLEAADIQADITINNGEENIRISPGETVEFDVQVDLKDASVNSVNDGGSVGYYDPEELFPNGYFIEGFVTLTDPKDNNPELSVPYVGFKGDWNAPPVLDELAYDENDSFYENAGMVYEDENDYVYLGHDPFTDERSTSNIAISPNGEQDRIIPLLSYLRNAKLVEYNVLDENKKQLRKIKSETNITKNYFDGGTNAPYRLAGDIFWDGTVRGKVVEDGQYYFEIQTTIDYPDAEAQSLQVPVIVDTVAPEVTASMDGKKVIIEATDEGSGVKYIEVFVDGESQGIIPPTEEEFEFDEALPVGTNVTIMATDYAGNTGETLIGGVNDTEGPVIYVDTPDTFSIHDTSEVTVSGSVEDKSEVVEFTIEGKDVELVWDEDNESYTFETEITFDEDGAHPIHVYAKDAAGNETSLANSRTIFVDTTAPVIELGEMSTTVSNDTDSIELVSTISDNAEELTYIINGDEVFANDMPGNDMIPFSTEVTTKLDLDLGENNFKLELIDLAGHVTTEEITITRENVSRIEGKTHFETAVEISKTGWETAETVILARVDDHSDALAGVSISEKYDAPILYTNTDSLPQFTKDEILRLGAEDVIILGGPTAISEKVEEELASEFEVDRISGSNRYATAVAIAERVLGDNPVEQAILVNPALYNFTDGLSVGAHAANSGIPIFFVDKDDIPKETEKVMEDLGIENTLAIGGPLAISEEVLSEFPNVERIFGATRYDTAVEIAKYFDVDTNKYYVATSNMFNDALAGATLAAKEETGVLLVSPDSVSEEFKNYVTTSDFEMLTLLGGPTAISLEVEKEIIRLLK